MKMRRFVLFLLLLNGVLFAFLAFKESQDAGLDKTANTSFNYAEVPSIVLLNEVPKSELLQRNKKRIEDEDRRRQAAINKLCYLIGPMEDERIATRMRIRMGYENTVRVVSQSTQLPKVFKVYIEPQATRQAALSLEKRLRSDGFDSYAEPNGEDANAVALGVFSKLKSAESVASKGLEKGYEVKIAERQREKQMFYVALGELETADFDQEIIEKVRAELPDVKTEEKSCKSLALLKSFP
jgi:hypothetical protein